jgi:hypothetical protein
LLGLRQCCEQLQYLRAIRDGIGIPAAAMFVEQ